LNDGSSTINVNLNTIDTIEVDTYEIIAYIGDLNSRAYTFHVEGQPMKSIKLDLEKYTMKINDTVMSIATVDQNGKITAHSIGKTNLKAKSMDGTNIEVISERKKGNTNETEKFEISGGTIKDNKSSIIINVSKDCNITSGEYTIEISTGEIKKEKKLQ